MACMMQQFTELVRPGLPGIRIPLTSCIFSDIPREAICLRSLVPGLFWPALSGVRALHLA
jgi:hypothetical protein